MTSSSSSPPSQWSSTKLIKLVVGISLTCKDEIIKAAGVEVGSEEKKAENQSFELKTFENFSFQRSSEYPHRCRR